MTTYTHHINGRLRTRYERLRNNPALARTVEAVLKRTDGVLFAEASTLTGSLLIRYDAYRPGQEALLRRLYQVKEQLGLKQDPPQRAVRSSQPAASFNIGDAVADKVIGMVVEKAIERSTFALFAALL